MICGQQNQNISCRYCNMRQYQNPAVTMKNRLATLTEESVAAVGVFPQIVCPYLLVFCIC